VKPFFRKTSAISLFGFFTALLSAKVFPMVLRYVVRMWGGLASDRFDMILLAVCGVIAVALSASLAAGTFLVIGLIIRRIWPATPQ
jgi:hypothetical protein